MPWQAAQLLVKNDTMSRALALRPASSRGAIKIPPSRTGWFCKGFAGVLNSFYRRHKTHKRAADSFGGVNLIVSVQQTTQTAKHGNLPRRFPPTRDAETIRSAMRLSGEGLQPDFAARAALEQTFATEQSGF